MNLRGRLARIGAPLRVCLSACVYEPEPARRRLCQMLDSAVAAGTTDFAIAVDRKSVPGTVTWVRRYLLRRRGLIASLLRPARVTEFRWQDDFAHARNVALDLVPRECEWWFAIDADDRLERTGTSALPDYLSTFPAEVRSVCIPYVCPDKDGRLVNVMSYETFFRGPIAYRWERAWGERIEPLDRRHILHARAGEPFRRVHDQDRSVPRLRVRNHGVMVRAVTERPDDPGLWSFLGQNYASRCQFDDAVRCLQRAVVLAPTTRHRYGYTLTLIRILLAEGRADDVLRAALDAQQLQQQFPEGYILEGRARFLLGDFSGAIAAVEAGLARMGAVAQLGQRQHDPGAGNPIQLYECEPYFILAEAHGQLGNFDQAVANAERALRARPPLYFEEYIAGLRQQCAAGERPPFVGAQFAEGMAATAAAIRKLMAYESEEKLLADLDETTSEVWQLMAAPLADRDAIVQYAEAYFGERL